MEFSDDVLKNPKEHFYHNRLVIGRIIKIQKDGKIDISLRESIIKYGYKYSKILNNYY